MCQGAWDPAPVVRSSDSQLHAILPPRDTGKCLETLAVVTAGAGGLVSRGQGCCQPSYSTQHGPTAKNDPAFNVSRAKDERPAIDPNTLMDSISLHQFISVEAKKQPQVRVLLIDEYFVNMYFVQLTLWRKQLGGKKTKVGARAVGTRGFLPRLSC